MPFPFVAKVFLFLMLPRISQCSLKTMYSFPSLVKLCKYFDSCFFCWASAFKCGGIIVKKEMFYRQQAWFAKACVPHIPANSPGFSKFFSKSPGLSECLLGNFRRLFLDIVENDILTMQRFLDVFRFLYYGGWQVC